MEFILLNIILRKMTVLKSLEKLHVKMVCMRKFIVVANFLLEINFLAYHLYHS